MCMSENSDENMLLSYFIPLQKSNIDVGIYWSTESKAYERLS